MFIVQHKQHNPKHETLMVIAFSAENEADDEAQGMGGFHERSHSWWG